MSAEVRDSVVIGAGQAGLSASRHLQRRGIDHVVLDAERAPGGAWQHRSPSLTMADVHGVADLPDLAAPPATSERAARAAVPAYFAAYEQRFALPVRRPVQVRAVRPRPDGLIDVETDAGTWTTRTIVNATGTWRHPFVPAVPGAASFAGRQLHSSAYRGPGEFAGARVLVVGGGASAVQTIGELAGVAADVVWATRSEPRWSSEAEEFDGRAAVARVIERVERGLAPQSVVSVTGLRLREQEQAARRLGWYDARRPMPARLVADGAVWADGAHERVDAVIWATGFRAVLDHLAPLRLREPGGGIRMSGTTAAADPRVQLVGYGPSASTIGANRAGRDAAIAVRDRLRSVLAAAEHDLVPAGNGGASAGTA